MRYSVVALFTGSGERRLATLIATFMDAGKLARQLDDLIVADAHYALDCIARSAASSSQVARAPVDGLCREVMFSEREHALSDITKASCIEWFDGKGGLTDFERGALHFSDLRFANVYDVESLHVLTERNGQFARARYDGIDCVRQMNRLMLDDEAVVPRVINPTTRRYHG